MMHGRADTFWRVTFFAIAMAFASGQATSQPVIGKFTISKETTIVDGPLNKDGTINYVPAINKLIGEGVKNEENAALLFMPLEQRIVADERTNLAFDSLKAPRPQPGGPRITYFSDFKAKNNVTADKIPTEEESLKAAELQETLKQRPWKALEHEDVVLWLKTNEESLKTIEKACTLPRFFVPFVAVKDPPVALDGRPMVTLFTARDALAIRAMLRAGEGDTAGALDDIRRIRGLARFLEQEHDGLIHLMGIAIESSALRACAGMAQSGMLNKEQLQAVRKEIESLPTLPSEDPIRSQVDEMIALDMIMDCLRGNSEHLMQLMAFDFSLSKHIDLGDWPKADWDVALKEVRRLCADDGKPEMSFAQKLEDLKKKDEEISDQGPSALEALAKGKIDPGIPAVESFLKLRPGETREAFTRRITKWLVGGNASDERRMVSLDERGRMIRELALLTLRLAEYRLAKGAYPDSLESLGKPILQDSFSGKDMLYRKDAEGYTLWSVSLNQKDDGAAEDDIVFRAGTLSK